MILAAMACGGLVGIGAWFGVRAFAAQPASLDRDLAALRQPRWPDQPQGSTAVRARAKAVAVRVGAAAGDSDRLRADLALLERTEERFAVERCVTALVFAALPALFALVVTPAAVTVDPALVAVMALGLGAVGFFVPVLTVRADADRRRRSARHALGAYLDVITVLLAGGHGPTSALADAAGLGQGWLFNQLNRSLQTAASSGQAPWDELALLAERLQLPDLYEFASSMTLAATAGAAVRETLLAKAETLRVKALAEAEATAQHNSELLVIPTVALLIAFILLLGFPATYSIIGL